MINTMFDHNKKIHDNIFSIYNLKHSEIYNDIEQSRLKSTISKVIKLSKKKSPTILDVGAGTGNLALKFLSKNCKVTAADISKKSLDLLKHNSFDNKNLLTKLIIDDTLPFENNCYDIVCCYSVLHHIPDYLKTIEEMIRVAKKGGLIYIDHETNENRWDNNNKKLLQYYKKNNQTFKEHLIKLFKTKELFSFEFIKAAILKTFVDKKYQREGDIHVWLEDHIEWKKIKALFKKTHCKIILEKDYLMYKPKGKLKEYLNLKEQCNDTKYIIIKKLR